MPRRKQEEYEERRAQILAGALEVFAKKGFTLATNKEIATAAGIQSPGLLYYYFKDKADLFRAVMETYAPPLQLLAHTEEIYALPPAEALTRIGMAYIGMLNEPHLSAFMRLVIGQAIQEPELARVVGEAGPMRILPFVAGYLQTQMERGTLRRADPHLAARAFLGPFVLQMLAENILGIAALRLPDPAAFVAAQVDWFLNGLSANV